MATKSVTSRGAQVAFTRRNGETVKGRVVESEQRRNGTWVTVNSAEPKKPMVKHIVRETQLSFA